MAASRTTVATTLEAQMLEVASAMQIAELADTTNNPNNVQVTPDFEAGTVSITATLPATFSLNTDGSLKVIPTVYLT